MDNNKNYYFIKINIEKYEYDVFSWKWLLLWLPFNLVESNSDCIQGFLNNNIAILNLLEPFNWIKNSKSWPLFSKIYPTEILKL